MLPHNGKNKNTYRGLNLWMLMMAPYANPRYLTPKQINELGGNIKKDEKSWPVYFWTTLEDKKTGKKRPFCKGYKVFNTSQTENLPEQYYKLDEVAKNDPIPCCEHIVNNFENPPNITTGNQACYFPSLDCINVPDKNLFNSAEEYYSTLFHELGHSTGHKSRLNRDGITKATNFGSHDYSREELVAEFTAAGLCAIAGIAPKTLDNSASYIASWLKKLKAEPEVLILASREASKATDHILGKKYNEEE
jgi:antirestriction protein ArdC